MDAKKVEIDFRLCGGALERFEIVGDDGNLIISLFGVFADSLAMGGAAETISRILTRHSTGRNLPRARGYTPLIDIDESEGRQAWVAAPL